MVVAALDRRFLKRRERAGGKERVKGASGRVSMRAESKTTVCAPTRVFALLPTLPLSLLIYLSSNDSIKSVFHIRERSVTFKSCQVDKTSSIFVTPSAKLSCVLRCEQAREERVDGFIFQVDDCSCRQAFWRAPSRARE